MTPDPTAGFGMIDPGAKPADIQAPDRSALFIDRARRFATLADGHSMGGYLTLLGKLSQLQHECLRAHPDVPLPDADALALAHTHRMPPLPAAGWPRDPVWRQHLRTLAAGLRPDAPAAFGATLAALEASDDATLEALADAVLRVEYDPAVADRLPLVAAALQVYWAYMASTPALRDLARIDVPGVCPCCGSLPVSSVLRLAGDVTNLRYLHCSLCSTQWHAVRAKCTQCDGTRNVSYRHLDGDKGIVRAECCGDCHSYIKVVLQEKDPLADPVADDLASLVLDILVDEQGFQRTGPNPLFIPGAA